MIEALSLRDICMYFGNACSRVRVREFRIRAASDFWFKLRYNLVLRSEVPCSKPPHCNQKSIAFPLLRTAAFYRGGKCNIYLLWKCL